MENKEKNILNDTINIEKINGGEILGKVQRMCTYLPLITTVSAAICLAFDDVLPLWVENYIFFPMTIVGWIAALFVSGPFVFIKSIFKFAVRGFQLGAAVAGLAGALLFGGVGGVLALALMIFVPAFFTIPSVMRKE